LIRTATALFIVALCGNAMANDGAKLYQHCSACHLPDGAGIPGVFPPLRNRIGTIAADEHGRTYVVMVIIAGLMGPIEVDGMQYRGVMPAQPISDADVALVLNYLGTTLAPDEPGDWQDFSEEEVAKTRKNYPKWTGQASLELREKVQGL